MKKEVTDYRYTHSLGVAETAKHLAQKYGADSVKAELAGILHDFAKFWAKEKLELTIKANSILEQDLLDYNAELWHGPVASILIQERFDIHDEEIVLAVRYHTSGRENMSLLEKVVCLADYIEPSRQFPGVEEIREIAEQDIDEALRLALDGTIQFLIKKKMKIYPLTMIARNNLLKNREKQ
ncbi:bis(5'-nucleosyl)-tetraphosphatase (symmetrical) YqeK [Tepidibacillus marianensis]|uniref:bis(5'-nucleosyl)-tetraphosphatase (symmetrical) YqeK n=1 Tax=Tepidibacillus marianensis TaxID=3131995 RepID=UPI0030CB86D8